MAESCRICSESTTFVEKLTGSYNKREFELRRCPSCGYAFIADPWTDFAAIYDANYYAGKGADHLANYTEEAAHPEAVVRVYEWEGLCRIVRELGPAREPRDVSWLDYGAGNG